ncbi:MAG: PAS domain S-box protein [Deltaproteobacteria bacterium]|nr:PAS domain S-box protein [Deltaproteobacteria bacterium]
MTPKAAHENLEARVEQLERELVKWKNKAGEMQLGNAQLAQVIQSISIPTFVIDHDHMVTHFNAALEDLTGVPADRLIGTRNPWQAFYATERRVMADFLVDNVPSEEIAKAYEGKYRESALRKGEVEGEDFFQELGEEGKWLFFTAAALRDETGNITGAVETLQDITARKKAQDALQESERRYRTVLDFSPYPMVVFTLNGHVSYLNPAFTETFGWTFKELKGNKIPYVPPGLEQQVSQGISKLFKDKVIPRFETRRLTKDGGVLDVVMRAVVYSETGEEPTGQLVILRDVTQEKRNARNNEAMLRISTALPRNPDLEELLDYICSEVMQLLNTEGCIVNLLDEERQEFYFLGAAYDDAATQQRVKSMRFSMDLLSQFVVIKGLKTGEPIIVNDTSKLKKSYPVRDEKLRYNTKNFLQVTLKSGDRYIGTLCPMNRKEGTFDAKDVELLNMVAGTVVLSIENARSTEQLKEAYRELTSLDRAKDKVINHLSHELKTPVSVLTGALTILSRRLAALPEDTWKPAVERAQRNVARISDIQATTQDILLERNYKTYNFLSMILDQCSDELQTLVAEEVGEGPLVQRISERIEQLFGPKGVAPEAIDLCDFINDRLAHLAPHFSARQVELITYLDATPIAYIPHEVLQRVIDGLTRNAIENTPDGGKIEISLKSKGEGSELLVRDYGAGITDENKRRIFEGFFTTHETMQYSSKRPFDFNAGGKGIDLLSIKIFSERYNFITSMTSVRCSFIPESSDICPGVISNCPFCKQAEDCYRSGGSTFSVYFPPGSIEEQAEVERKKG